MKKILLYGDSVRIGYDVTVRGILADKAEVYFPQENCRFSNYLFRFLHIWPQELGVKPEEVDIVHWNAGLWDTLILDEFGPMTSLSEYKANINRICHRMKKLYPNSKFIFATSTPMQDDDCAYRKNSDIRRYNEAAVEIVKSHGMEVNDLYSIAENAPRDWYSDETHLYTMSATVAFTRQVAGVICKVLDIGLPQKSDSEILAYAPSQVEIYGI